MAYNNYYPMNYGYGQMNNQFPTQNQQQNNNGIIWVVGENGADSYLVAPGQTVLLWDSTAPVLYLKSADNMGRPAKRILDYTERGIPQNENIQPQHAYASKEDVDYLKEEIESLKAKFEDTKGAKK
jgi:hypothetical protein